MTSLGSVVVATQDYVAQYPDPITVSEGDRVRVDREDDEFRSWWWCVAEDGRAGWVPGDLLEPAPAPGSTARLRTDYTARELSVRRGTPLAALEERAGWLFVRAPNGATGWLPTSHTMSGST